MKKHTAQRHSDGRSAAGQAVRITGIYLALGLLWILFSDILLQRLVADQELIARLQSVKGAGFVLLTGAVIYTLLHRTLLRLHRSNRELRESREEHRSVAEYLGAIFETAPLGIYDLDPEGRVRSLWNRAAERTFGWSREEVLGGEPPFVPEAKRDEFRRLFREVLYGRRITGTEVSRRRKDGSTVIVELVSAPLQERQGEVTGVLSLVSDITDKRRREEELQRALEEKRVLLREVHHRVKNNLQVIISLLNMKEELVESPADREIVLGILSRVEAMALIHDKLYQADGLEQIDFDAYLRELSSNLALEYAARSRGIELEYSGQQAVLEIDRAVPLGMLVNELLSNALRHAFPDGRGGRVMMELTRGERDLLVRVADDGVGIPEELLGGSGEPERTGINLAYLFAEQAGGTLELASGNGTEALVRYRMSGREEER